MQISQWELAKAFFNGFANVFLNYRIMIPVVVALLVIFAMKKGLAKLASKIQKVKFNRSSFASNQSSICPKCGSKLVSRTARKGSNAGDDFLGCSSFPACRYIKTLK
jgi:formate dehydrogenase maturation protein FdhE